MLHNFRRSKLLENWNSSIIFEVETKYKVHLTQKLTGLKFKMASLSVERSILDRKELLCKPTIAEIIWGNLVLNNLTQENRSLASRPFLSSFDIYRNLVTFSHHLQWWSEIVETSAKNSVVPVATSNAKLFLKTIWWG